MSCKIMGRSRLPVFVRSRNLGITITFFFDMNSDKYVVVAIAICNLVKNLQTLIENGEGKTRRLLICSTS